MKYIAYYRTSTKDQNLGIAAQRTTVLKFIAPDTLVAEYTEQESGKNNRRLELNKALQHCKEVDGTLIIAKLDRLSRDRLFIAQLMDSKVRFKCCDLPEANDFTIHLFSGLAHHEREIISARTKAALDEIKATLAREGVATSKSGNTFTSLGKNNMTDAIRSKAVATIKENAKEANKQATELIGIYRAMGMTFDAIASKLNELGYRTRTGKQFIRSTVKILHDRYTVRAACGIQA